MAHKQVLFQSAAREKIDKRAIAGRTEQLRRQIKEAKSDYGAPTEAELKSRKEAFEDAIGTTKAAVAEGVVAGGGLTLLRANSGVDGGVVVERILLLTEATMTEIPEKAAKTERTPALD